jgi:hypothetical protein
MSIKTGSFIFRLFAMVALLALLTGVMGLAPAHAIGLLYDKLSNAVSPSVKSYVSNSANAPTSATISDMAGNPLSNLPYTGGQSYTIDRTAPMVVSILRTSKCKTSLASVNFTVTFSEDVDGVDTVGPPFDDFTLITSSGISRPSIMEIIGSGKTYTVKVNTGDGNGTIRLDVIDKNSIKDIASNLLGGAVVGDGSFDNGEIYTIAPSVYKLFLPLLLR